MKGSRGREAGFTFVEILMVVAILGIMAGLAIGVSNSIVRMSRAESAAQQIEAFLRRHRETAIARRRDIEVRFEAPNRLRSLERAVPPAVGTTELDEIVLEGRSEYRLMPGVPDTPNQFGNANPVTLGGPTPVMFSSEGAFTDAANNPINATISLGTQGDPMSATAVTILGATATIERWRWNGTGWSR